MKIKFYLTIFTLSISFGFTLSQNDFGASEALKLYPHSNYIILNETESVNISIKGDKLNYEFTRMLRHLHQVTSGVTGNVHQIEYRPDYSIISEINGAVYDFEKGKYKKKKTISITDEERIQNDVFYDGSRYKKVRLSEIADKGISEISYKTEIIDPLTTLSFYFQDYSPTLYKELNITVPTEVEFGVYFMGDSSNIIIERKTEGKKQKIKYIVKNVSPLGEYNDDPGFKHYCPHLVFYIKSWQNKNGRKDFNCGLKCLYSNLENSVSNLNQELADHDLIKVCDSLQKIAGANKELLAKKIYYWIKDNVKYIAFEDGEGSKVPRQANDIFHKKFGDCKDYSSLITFMFKQVGIHACLAWIGTDVIPYSPNNLPVGSVFNHMIVALPKNNDYIFLDGTSTSTPLGFPSMFIQGKEAVIRVAKDSFVIKKVPVIPAEMNMRKRIISAELSANNTLKLHARSEMHGYGKYNFIDFLITGTGKVAEKQLKSVLFEGSNKASVESHKVENLYERDSAARFTYEVKLPDWVNEVNNDIFINLNFTKPFQEEYKADTSNNRKVGKALRHAFEDVNIYELEIPKGYKVKYIPENYTYHDDLMDIGFIYKHEGNKLSLIQNFTYRKRIVSPDYFGIWNSTLDKIQDAYREVVVLTKK